MKQFVFCILLFSLHSLLSAHPVHVSVVNMEVREDAMRIDYTIRIFHDDYHYLVYGIYHDEQAEAEEDSSINIDNTIAELYFQKNFQLFMDGKPMLSVFSGIQKSENDIYLSFSVNLVKIPEVIEIENKILINEFSDQTNLLILACGSKEEGFVFDQKQTKQRIVLKNI